jgi:hypothetical protein
LPPGKAAILGTAKEASVGRRVVSAVQLSDIFAKRFRDMYPATRVTGFQVKSEGDGEWLPLGYLGSLDMAASADAAAILQEMKAQFLIDE